jgi:hypothetical protein
MASEQDDTNKKTEDNNVRKNIQSIIMYALSMTVALGVNNLVTSVFNSLYNTAHIISKTTYVVTVFGLTLVVAYWLSSTSIDAPLA